MDVKLSCEIRRSIFRGDLLFYGPRRVHVFAINRFRRKRNQPDRPSPPTIASQTSKRCFFIVAIFRHASFGERTERNESLHRRPNRCTSECSEIVSFEPLAKLHSSRKLDRLEYKVEKSQRRNSRSQRCFRLLTRRIDYHSIENLQESLLSLER